MYAPYRSVIYNNRIPNLYNTYEEQQELFNSIYNYKKSNYGGGNCLWYSLLQSGILGQDIQCPNDARTETAVLILNEHNRPDSYLKQLVNKKDLYQYLDKINTSNNWTQGIDTIGFELIFYTLSGTYNTCIVLIINNGKMNIAKIYNKNSRKRIFLYLSSEHYEFCDCNDNSFLQQISINNFETIMP